MIPIGPGFSYFTTGLILVGAVLFGLLRLAADRSGSDQTIWFDMDLNWDGQFDVRLSISYDRFHIIHIILCYN